MDGRRDWDWHKVVDISPFLRYESSGDSDQVNSADLNRDHAEVKNCEADDALSCCSDSYDNTSSTFNKNYGDRDKERAQLSKKSKKKEECYATCLENKSKKKEEDLGYNPNYRDGNDDDDDDDDEDDGSINNRSSCGNIGYAASSQQKKKKISESNAFDGSSMEPKEKNDKLFWDTCLDN